MLVRFRALILSAAGANGSRFRSDTRGDDIDVADAQSIYPMGFRQTVADAVPLSAATRSTADLQFSGTKSSQHSVPGDLSDGSIPQGVS